MASNLLFYIALDIISLRIYTLQLIAENVTLSFDRLQGLFICGQHHTSPYTSMYRERCGVDHKYVITLGFST